MNTPTPAKPRPIVNPWAQSFWDGTRDGRLMIQHCENCDARVFYPRIACPTCGSQRLGWMQASGRGTIYSYTVVKNNAPSAFAADVPYVVAVIRLEEGVQMLSNIVDWKEEDLRCELPVTVVFEQLEEDFVLPKFRPAAAGEDA